LYIKPFSSQVATLPSNALAIYISGQTSLNPYDEIIGKNDIRLQTKQAIKNLKNAIFIGKSKNRNNCKYLKNCG